MNLEWNKIQKVQKARQGLAVLNRSNKDFCTSSFSFNFQSNCFNRFLCLAFSSCCVFPTIIVASL